jgi:hypothetical protein
MSRHRRRRQNTAHRNRRTPCVPTRAHGRDIGPTLPLVGSTPPDAVWFLYRSNAQAVDSSLARAACCRGSLRTQAALRFHQPRPQTKRASVHRRNDQGRCSLPCESRVHLTVVAVAAPTLPIRPALGPVVHYGTSVDRADLKRARTNTHTGPQPSASVRGAQRSSQGRYERTNTPSSVYHSREAHGRTRGTKHCGRARSALGLEQERVLAGLRAVVRCRKYRPGAWRRSPAAGCAAPADWRARLGGLHHPAQAVVQGPAHGCTSDSVSAQRGAAGAHRVGKHTSHRQRRFRLCGAAGQAMGWPCTPGPTEIPPI